MKQAGILLPAFTLLTLACGVPPTSEPEINVRVDPRVELVSILFQMAGRDEYNMTRVSAWQKSVEERFQPFADHPAVLMTERLAGHSAVDPKLPFTNIQFTWLPGTIFVGYR